MNGVEILEKIHELLKGYGCKRTFSFHPELESRNDESLFFYQALEENTAQHDSLYKPEWREKINAKLDVCIPTKMPQAIKKEIRFCIEWSDSARLFSMYISLPTSGRSIPLSKATYKSYHEIMPEIMNWLKKAGCKQTVNKVEVKKVESEYEQLSFF